MRIVYSQRLQTNSSEWSKKTELYLYSVNVCKHQNWMWKKSCPRHFMRNGIRALHWLWISHCNIVMQKLLNWNIAWLQMQADRRLKFILKFGIRVRYFNRVKMKIKHYLPYAILGVSCYNFTPTSCCDWCFTFKFKLLGRNFINCYICNMLFLENNCWFIFLYSLTTWQLNNKISKTLRPCTII